MAVTDWESVKTDCRRSDMPMMRAQSLTKAKLKKRRKRRMMIARLRRGTLFLIFMITSIIFIKFLIYPFETPETPATDHEASETSTSSFGMDTVAPVIQGVQPMMVYIGDTVSYRKGVTVLDEIDPNPSLEIDTSRVNLSQPGIYPVIYLSKDKSENTCRQETTIEVRERKDGFVSSNQITEKVDSLIDEIIEEDMLKREKVTAVYVWLRKNCAYGGHSDRSDYMQAAYSMITQKTGDCYGYFAAAKLLFERMGIDNLDVRKVKNAPTDSNHFWSMVSLDDGKTWYHFDATPRVGDGDDFCMVTDAFLDAYSIAHKNSHNRDKSLYPATPEY